MADTPALTDRNLEATTNISLKREPACFAFLSPRSIYHMTGEVRHAWEHSIAPMDEARWSVTFRTLADQSATSPGD